MIVLIFQKTGPRAVLLIARKEIRIGTYIGIYEEKQQEVEEPVWFLFHPHTYFPRYWPNLCPV